MKKNYLLSILILISAIGHAQGLTEITGINIYEHHFSGCGPCAPSSLGDSSAYDFVVHQHVNAVFPSFDPNRDMVEHQGDPNAPAPFGFTSDTSSVWAGQFGGNGTTKYYLATGFDYANATQSSILSAYNDATATTDVNSVQAGEVYIAKIRGLDYYVVFTITAFQTNTDNDFTFDYKYTDNPITTNSISENEQTTSLNVYPNPSSSVVNIQYKESYNNINISIVNVYGSEVLSSQFNNSSLINLNLEELSNGIYFILSETDGIKTQIKFVKED